MYDLDVSGFEKNSFVLDEGVVFFYVSGLDRMNISEM